MTEVCGCETREGHVEPFVCDVLGLRHGERYGDDPLPHEVPGHDPTRSYFPDVYCFCGHPNYPTCEERDGGGMRDLTVHSVGGYILTTLDTP